MNVRQRVLLHMRTAICKHMHLHTQCNTHSLRWSEKERHGDYARTHCIDSSSSSNCYSECNNFIFHYSAACNSFVCVKSFAHLAVLFQTRLAHTFLRLLWSVPSVFYSQDKELRQWTGGLTGSEENPYKTHEQFNLFKQLYFGPCVVDIVVVVDVVVVVAVVVAIIEALFVPWHVWNDFDRKMK